MQSPHSQDGVLGQPEPFVTLPVVLLVEDDLVAAELTMSLLAHNGLCNPIVHLADGADALGWLSDRVAADDPPVLVLLDLHLPNCSGLDILRWMRQHTQEVQVIMLTAAADLDDINEAYNLGIASYLVKPIGASAIAEIVRGLTLQWALLRQAR